MFSYSDYLEERIRAKTLAEAAVEAAADKQKALEERDTTIASKMLKSGASVEYVHDITGLAMAVINNLRTQMGHSVPSSGMVAPA